MFSAYNQEEVGLIELNRASATAIDQLNGILPTMQNGSVYVDSIPRPELFMLLAIILMIETFCALKPYCLKISPLMVVMTILIIWIAK